MALTVKTSVAVNPVEAHVDEGYVRHPLCLVGRVSKTCNTKKESARILRTKMVTADIYGFLVHFAHNVVEGLEKKAKSLEEAC